MTTPLAEQVVACRALRTRVEKAFLDVLAALRGAIAGGNFQSWVQLDTATGLVQRHLDSESGPCSAHTALLREAAEENVRAVLPALLGLFPPTPAYAEATTWAFPVLRMVPSLGTRDGWTVGIDIDQSGVVAATPRSWPLSEGAQALSALWTIPLAYPEPADDPGVWQLAEHAGSGLFKPRFWAPDSFSAQLAGAVLWEPKLYHDWLCGQSLRTIVRRMPRREEDNDHLRALFV